MEIKAKDKKQINFFQRIKKAIFELEDYGFFLGERLSVAFKYLFLLTMFVSLLVTCSESYQMTRMLNKAYNYIQNELPDFTFVDGILESTKYAEGYDEDFDFKIIIDTQSELSKEVINTYKNKIYDYSDGVVLLRDKFILVHDGSELENSYDSLTNVTIEGEQINLEKELKLSNKQELISTIDEAGISNVVFTYTVIIFIGLALVNLMVVLSDVFVLSILGLVSAKICGVNFKMDPMMTLSIYALTLSIVLDTILDIVLIITGFSVPYFEAIRLLIAYVYVIAAIFMIKYDLIKQQEELQKIAEIQKQVREDLKNENNNNEEKQLEENKKDEESKKEKSESEKNDKQEDANKNNEPTLEENREPDGSEI